MNKILSFILLALMPWLASAQTVINPDYEYRLGSIYSIRSIERTAESTRFNIRATFRHNWWFCFSAKDAIVNTDNPDQKFLPTAIENLNFDEHRYMVPEGVHDFTVVYPPLPAEVERVDLMDDGRLAYKGISLTQTRHDPFAGQRERWLDAHPEAAVKEMQRMGQPITEKHFFKFGTATLRGQIGHYNKSLALSVKCLLTDVVFGDYQPVDFTLDDDGSFEFTVPVTGPATIEMQFFFPSQGYYASTPIYTEPGQTLDVFVDWEEDILAFDRSRGQLPYVPMTLRGSLAEVNRQIQEAPTIQYWSPKAERSFTANVVSMNRHYHADMPAVMAYIKRSGILPKAKQYIETEARMAFARTQLLMPTVFRMEVLRKEDVSSMDGNVLDKMDKSYFDFLRQIDMNDVRLLATPKGVRFFEEFGRNSTNGIFNEMVWGDEQTNIRPDSLPMRRARFLGYDKLPLIEQFVQCNKDGRMYYTLFNMVSRNQSFEAIDDSRERYFRNNAQTDVDVSNVTHPRIKAFLIQMKNDFRKMVAEIEKKPSARREWLKAHPNDDEAGYKLCRTDYDPDTFFTSGSVTVHGTLGNYDIRQPQMVRVQLYRCGRQDDIADIPVADDGTFTIEADIMHPGMALVCFVDSGTPPNRIPPFRNFPLYLESGHTLDLYVNHDDVVNSEARGDDLPFLLHGDLRMMNRMLDNRPRFYTSTREDGIAKNVERAKQRWAEDTVQVQQYYAPMDMVRVRHYIRSEIMSALAAYLYLLPMRCAERRHDGVVDLETKVNAMIQEAGSIDYYAFLRDVPADDYVMCGTTTGSELIWNHCYKGICDFGVTRAFDAMNAGCSTFTDEVDEEADMERRLNFYGTGQLPLFEQVGLVCAVQWTVKTLMADDVSPSSCADWIQTRRAWGERYITLPALRKALNDTLDTLYGKDVE